MDPPNLATLQNAIKQLYNRDSAHLFTVPVKEVYAGRLLWQGNVETFSLLGEGTARRCYAWTNETDGNEITVVLEITPVVSPVTAVRSTIVANLFRKRTQKFS